MAEEPTYEIREETGTYCFVEQSVLVDWTMNHLDKIFGMSPSAIYALRNAYLKYGGELPATEESVHEVFKRLKTVV